MTAPETTVETLKDLLSARVEPWMDVLFVGLSPELISTDVFPSHLATVRQGGNIPGDPWDAVFLRWSVTHDDLAPALKQAATSLRHGGQIGLVALPPAPDDLEPMDEMLRPFGGDPEELEADDGSVAIIARQLDSGRQDLVGLRRCLSTLTRNVERLEALCADVRERMGGRRPVEGGRSLKEMVGHLGDADRLGYVACIRGILEDAPPPDVPIDFEDLLVKNHHNGRPLAELVTRYRHFRYQTLDLLSDLVEDDWLVTGPGPDGREATVADLVRQWAREEELRIEEVARRVL